MQAFFHGWRRKVGVVLLVMVLGLMAGWIRSLMIHDLVVLYPPGSAFHMIESGSGRVSWARVLLLPPGLENEDYYWPTWSSTPLIKADDSDSWWQNRTIEWRWRCGEFDFAAGEHYGDIPRVQRWAIPYWSLTVPLTLLSAYLLFWKPRNRV